MKFCCLSIIRKFLTLLVKPMSKNLIKHVYWSMKSSGNDVQKRENSTNLHFLVPVDALKLDLDSKTTILCVSDASVTQV